MSNLAIQSSADPLAGIPILSPETVGRYSDIERIALKLRDEYGPDSAANFADILDLSGPEVVALHHDPRFSLRPVQVPPEKYKTWFFLGGRGAGKTHAGSCAALTEATADPEARIMIVGPTYSEITKNQILGPSGVLTRCPPWFTPKYEPSKKLLRFPNGAEATFLPAQDADKFRGHACSFIWLDEIVAWKKDPIAVLKECRTIMRHTTARMRRLGLTTRMIITTTPAPTLLFREVLERKEGMFLARSTTFDNAANLDPAYVRQARRIANTTEGKREFLGELMFALDANLFRKVDWNRYRIHPDKRPERFEKVIVGLDPATGEKAGADMHGIVVVGIRTENDGLEHAYVLADLSLRSPSPSDWARRAVEACNAWAPFADRCFIFAESNTGGSMVKQMIRQVDKSVKVKTIRARNSKAERAAPVSALAEAGFIHMIGKHHDLERQLERFTGQAGGHARDDRVDAMCWPICRYMKKNRNVLGESTDSESEEDDE